jgi:hypothetical protein
MPLAHHCLLRRGEHVDAQRCCHASYFLSGSQALINLIYVLLLSLGMLAPYGPPVLPGIAVLVVPAVGLYLLAAGSAALTASATRSTWNLLLFGRTQSLE